MTLPQIHVGLPREAQGEGVRWGHRQGQLLAVNSWVGSGSCPAPAYRTLLQRGQRDPAAGPTGNAQVALATYTLVSRHGAGGGRSLRWPRASSAPSISQAHESTFPQGSLPSGDLAIYGNSGRRTPKAHGNGRWEGQNVCFPESSWVAALARQGLTAKAGHWLVAWAGGRQAWALLGGAQARALGHFPRLFLEEDEDAH